MAYAGHRLLVDAHSCVAGRTTGMERFARAIVPELVRVHGAEAWSCGRGRVARALNGAMTWSGGDSALLFPTNPPLHWARRSMPRTLFVVHDITPLTAPALCQPRTVRGYERFLPRCLDTGQVAAVSRHTANALAAYFAIPTPPIIGNVVVPPPDVDGEVTEARPFFLAVGTIEPRKRYDALLNAYEAYRAARRDPFRLVVVGRAGWAPPATFHRLQQTPGVQWHARLDDHALWTLYRGALCVVTASEHEGFNMPAFEAMSVGTVAVVPAGSPPEDIRAVAPSLVRTFSPGGTGLADALIHADAEVEIAARSARAASFPHARYTAASVASRLAEQLMPTLHGVPANGNDDRTRTH